jgi:hypothetical protein
LLGWIAGNMLVHDVALARFVAPLPEWFHYVASVVGALVVIVLGKVLGPAADEEAAR